MTIQTDGINKDSYGNKEIQEGRLVYAADTASTDTYVVTLQPAATEYVTGMVINFLATTANTGAATLNVNGLGAKTIKKNHDQDLATGDIEAGQILTMVYDGTVFQMQSQSATAVETGDSPSFVDITMTGELDMTVTTTDATGERLINGQIAQGTNGLTGTLDGIYMRATGYGTDSSNGTVRGAEIGARLPNADGTKAASVVTGGYFWADAKIGTATTLRGVEVSLDGGAGGTSTTASGVVVFNNSSAVQTNSYAIDINEGSPSGRKAFTADIRLQNGETISNATNGVVSVGGVALTGGTNTFNIANGTAALDIAAGANINLDYDLSNAGDLSLPAVVAGDLLYGSNTGVLSALAKGAANLGLFMNAGATAPEWAAGFKVLLATRDLTAAGAPTDVAYTGVGFKPSMIIAFGGPDDSAVFSIGAADVNAAGTIGTNRAGVADTFHIVNNYVLTFWTGATHRQYASLKTFDADGFTLTWTKADTPTGTALLYFVCFR